MSNKQKLTGSKYDVYTINIYYYSYCLLQRGNCLIY